jgi:KTSC domain
MAKAGGKVGANQGNAQVSGKPRTAALSAEEIFAGVEAGGAHDLGPWIETPSSSRVSRFRYDHLQRQLQVQWRNNKNAGYLYENVDYEGYRSFARVVSKGRHINSTLNNYVYRPMGPSEYDAPSNEKRRGLGSRVRT